MSQRPPAGRRTSALVAGQHAAAGRIGTAARIAGVDRRAAAAGASVWVRAAVARSARRDADRRFVVSPVCAKAQRRRRSDCSRSTSPVPLQPCGCRRSAVFCTVTSPSPASMPGAAVARDRAARRADAAARDGDAGAAVGGDGRVDARRGAAVVGDADAVIVGDQRAQQGQRGRRRCSRCRRRCCARTRAFDEGQLALLDARRRSRPPLIVRPLIVTLRLTSRP